MAKYMVIYVSVDDGEVEGVYESNTLGEIEGRAKEVTKPGAPLRIDLVSDKAIGTFYAESSPGCRYIHRRDCRYVKVCR